MWYLSVLMLHSSWSLVKVRMSFVWLMNGLDNLIWFDSIIIVFVTSQRNNKKLLCKGDEGVGGGACNPFKSTLGSAFDQNIVSVSVWISQLMKT